MRFQSQGSDLKFLGIDVERLVVSSPFSLNANSTAVVSSKAKVRCVGKDLGVWRGVSDYRSLAKILFQCPPAQFLPQSWRRDGYVVTILALHQFDEFWKIMGLKLSQKENLRRKGHKTLMFF